MPLGDALYTITMSASRPTTLTEADFTENDFVPTASRMAKVSNMIYITAVEIITNYGTAKPLFLEMFLNNTDETSHIWTLPVEGRYTSSANSTRNLTQFFQPIRANEVYFLLREDHPYPTARGGVVVDPSLHEILITVSGYPRNFT